MATATASFNTLPENVRSAIFELSKTYSDAPNFLNYIEQMALSNAVSERAKKTKYNISQRFKQAGVMGLGFDLLKGSFSFLKNIASPVQTNSLKDVKDYKSFSTQTNSLKDVRDYKAFPGLTPQEQLTKTDKSKTYFDKPTKVLIDGITDNGYRDLLVKLPDIIKRGILDAQKDAPDRYKELLKAVKDNKDQKTGGGFSLLEALGLSRLFSGSRLLPTLLKFLTGLGGIFTAIYAITTSDPWKGLAKLTAKGLLSVSGFTKRIQTFADNIVTKLLSLPASITKFITTKPEGFINKIVVNFTKKLIDIPGKLFLNFSIFIEKIFGKVAGGKVFDVGLKIFENILPKALKTGLTFLRKVPIIGTLLTIGVAVDRIRKGDYFGGFLDVLSGIAAMFPGIGTGIALAIDALNAFLDYKAGGIGEGKPSKLGIVSNWITGATKWISDKVKDIPYLGSFARAFEHMQKGEWLEGLKSLGHSIPFISELLDFLGAGETTVEGKPVDTTNLNKTINLFAELGSWAKTTIIDKITSWISGLYDWSKDKLTSLSETVGGWFGDVKTVEPELPQMKDGGIVTQATKAIVGEAGPEAIIPLDKYIDKEAFTLSNQMLEQIAGNTGATSNNIKILSEAILKLAQMFNDKGTASANNFFINGQQQQNFPSASEIAATNRDPIRSIRRQFMPQMA